LRAAATTAPLLLWRGLGVSAAAAQGVRRNVQSVRDHGATGDGRTLDTRAIQAAVDAAASSRGTAHFPPGTYRSGTVRLRSRVTIQLAAGATLVASPDDADFDPVEELGYESFADAETSSFRFALLQGQGLEDVHILGPGRIDGNRTSRDGPKPIALKECRKVELRNLTIANSGNYNVSLLGCDGVDIVGVTIVNGYSDGIDPDGCQDVRIAACRIDTRDDAIAIKTSFALGRRRPTRRVTVSDCHLTTIHNALKIGTETSADLEHIVFRNCTVVGRPHTWKGDLSSGVAIATADGGSIRHVTVSDIRMSGVRSPIFIRLGQRGRGQDVPAAGRLQNVSITNVEAVGAIIASSITGIPGHPVSDITLTNVRMTARGGGGADLAAQSVPEMERTYPDAYMFRDLPAYGLYCRHAERLTLDRVELGADQLDARPAVVLDDVARARLRAVHGMPPAEGGPLLWLRSVRDCSIEDLRPRAGTKTLLRLSGPNTSSIRLVRSDLRRVEKPAMVDPEVPATALRIEGILRASR
jgi:hypothetical protein